MTTLKLSDHIGNKQAAIFVKCANNVLWYRTEVYGFDFAVDEPGSVCTRCGSTTIARTARAGE